MPDGNSEQSMRPDIVTSDIEPPSYVGVWNVSQVEFPLIASAMSMYSVVPPLDVTMVQNGMRAMVAPITSTIYRPWARVQINQPAPNQAPLVIETLVLKTNELEPPVSAGSQYIRVVIRNLIIPEGTRDNP